MELDEDFTVRGADRGGFHPGQVDRIRCANVLDDELKLVLRNDVANLALDVGHDARGIFHANAAGNAHEEPDKAGIRLREKLASGLPARECSEAEDDSDRGKDEDLPPEKEGKNGVLRFDETVEPMLDRQMHPRESSRGDMAHSFVGANLGRGE